MLLYTDKDIKDILTHLDRDNQLLLLLFTQMGEELGKIHSSFIVPTTL